MEVAGSFREAVDVAGALAERYGVVAFHSAVCAFDDDASADVVVFGLALNLVIFGSLEHIERGICACQGGIGGIGGAAAYGGIGGVGVPS